MGYLPIYWQSAAYARDNGERDEYFASKKASIACRDAIEKAASEHYSGWHLDTDSILDTVVPEYGYDRVMLVLAATIRERHWDERISRENMVWAKTVRMPQDKDPDGNDRYTDYAVKRTHSCLMDILVSFARKYLPKRCYSILPSTGAVIIIKRGESGYYPCDFSCENKQVNRAISDEFNGKLGVSKAQERAMLAGSMFGWSVPAADPQRYDKNGKPLRDERNTQDMDR